MAAFVAAAGVLAGSGGPATASTSSSGSVVAATSVTLAQAPSLTLEQKLAKMVNTARVDNHRKAYTYVSTMASIAEQQARRMANKQTLYHNSHLTTDVRVWQAIGENVAYAYSLSAAHKALMNSPGHRANILSSTFTQMGLGVVKDSQGRYWVCEVFRKP